MDTASTKAELRKQMLAKRRALNPNDVALRSKQLSEILIKKIDWNNCQNIHVFLPLENDNEPDLRSFIEHVIEQNVMVYTSDPSRKTGRKVVELEDKSKQVQVIQYDTEKLEFDYIIVPMIVFDSQTNHRLGFGGGFYDRLLSTHPEAKTIGICFKEFEVRGLPKEPHDQPLEEIVSI